MPARLSKTLSSTTPQYRITWYRVPNREEFRVLTSLANYRSRNRTLRRFKDSPQFKGEPCFGGLCNKLSLSRHLRYRFAEKISAYNSFNVYLFNGLFFVFEVFLLACVVGDISRALDLAENENTEIWLVRLQQPRARKGPSGQQNLNCQKMIGNS